MTEKKKQSKAVIYQAKNGAIALRGDYAKETIWATQKEMAQVFGVDVRTISEHLANIYKTKELAKSRTIRKFRIVRKEGRREVQREIEHYSLDVMISVGYRVNSKVATQFRVWATKTLKQHLTEGYTINREVIKRNNAQFEKALSELQKLASSKNQITSDHVFDLVKIFAGTWLSLESYDEDQFPTKGLTKKKVKVQSSELYEAVATFKKELRKKRQATEIFAQEKKRGNLEGIFGNVFQSIFSKDAYPSVEEKAAHLLYFIVKNHPFTDGNKRTGAFAFIWFLTKAGMKFEKKITPEALTALTLLIAMSKPKEKDQMVGLVLLLLKK